jgi:hypothetical protein
VINVESQKQRYIYTYLNELFFAWFPYFLYEWVKRQSIINVSWGAQESFVWDHTTVNRMTYINNRWDRSIDFQFEWIKEGYIVKFTIKYNFL